MMKTKINHQLLPIYFLFFSISLAFEQLYLLSKVESNTIVGITLIYVSIIIFLEYLIILASSYIHKHAFYFLFGMLSAINLYTLKFLSFPSFVNLQPIITGLITFTMALALFFIAKKSDMSNKIPFKFVYSITLISLIIAPVASNFILSAKTEDTYIAQEYEILDAWSNIKLQDTPNIHLISFDSLIPDYIAKEYLNIDPLAYTDTFNKYFLTQPQAITPRVFTNRSLNSLMNLNHPKLSSSKGHFTGQLPSILSTVLRKNNYLIGTGSPSFYLGTRKGSHIDEYNLLKTPTLVNSMLCMDIKRWSQQEKLKLFNVCEVLKYHSQLSDLIKPSTYQARQKTAKNTYHDWPNKVVAFIQKMISQDQPTLTFQYIFRPIGHTKSKYYHDDPDQRDRYQKYFYKSSKELNSIFKNQIQTIVNNDPNSIILVFGDHGAFVSRDIKFEDNPRFFLTDRHTIHLGIMKSNHKCASQEALYYSNSYSTTARILAGVLRCLSESPKEIDKHVKFIDEQGPCINDPFANQIKLLSDPNHCIIWDEK